MKIVGTGSVSAFDLLQDCMLLVCHGQGAEECTLEYTSVIYGYVSQVYTPPTAGVLDGGAFSTFLQTNQANSQIAGESLYPKWLAYSTWSWGLAHGICQKTPCTAHVEQPIQLRHSPSMWCVKRTQSCSC